MLSRLKKSKKYLFSSILGVSILLVSFQNCGKAGFDSELGDNSEAASTDAALVEKYGSETAAKVQGIPFAFQGGFDTISYNSCADSHLKTAPGFFTLAAGAYSNQGISLNTEYFDYADQNFKPIYPATVLSENQYREFLADSPANKGVVANMAIRARANLTYLSAVDGTPAIDKDVIPMAGDLSDKLLMDSLFPRGTQTRYFPFSLEKKNIESFFVLNGSESIAEEVRSILTDSSALTFSFRPQAGQVQDIISSSGSGGSQTSVRTAYGKGYILSFSPRTGTAANNPRRILSSIQEYDLSTNRGIAGANWQCGNLLVASTKDVVRDPNLCPEMSFESLRNQETRVELAFWRRHLRPDQWRINLERGCAVRLGDHSCYREEVSASANYVVQYDGNLECFRPNGASNANQVCAHFISMCIRN